MNGVWIEPDGGRWAVSYDDVLDAAPASGAEVVGRVGRIVVWCSDRARDRDSDSPLNLVASTIVAASNGGIRFLAGPALVTGPAGGTLSDDQTIAILGGV